MNLLVNLCATAKSVEYNANLRTKKKKCYEGV